jgi:hypothetical protein
MSELIYNPSTKRFVKKDGAVGKKLKETAAVLLYCHGNAFDVDQVVSDIITISCCIIKKKKPVVMDSINIRKETFPTILTKDKNLPIEFSKMFNIVYDYNCDYTGAFIDPNHFEPVVIPLYKNMVRALNPDSWCLITGYDSMENCTLEPKIVKKAQNNIKKRLDFIHHLLETQLGNFSEIELYKNNNIYKIFYKSN